MVLLALPALREQRVFKETRAVQPAQPVLRELTGQQVHQDLREQQALPVRRDPQVLTGQQDLKALRVLQEQRVLLGPRPQVLFFQLRERERKQLLLGPNRSCSGTRWITTALPRSTQGHTALRQT
jgi:hypothetical protein